MGLVSRVSSRTYRFLKPWPVNFYPKDTPKRGNFGSVKIPDGEFNVEYVILQNDQICTKILNLGGIIQSLLVSDKNGNIDDIACGFNTPQEYITNHMYYGSVVGRVANRINNAQFNLNGKTYQISANRSPTHLHGGNVGWDQKIWKIDSVSNNAVKMSYFSKDGEEGYPCDVEASVEYKIEGEKLLVHYSAKNLDNEKSTIVNMTNHSYFNLAGHANYDKNLDNHMVKSDSEYYLPLNELGIPTGEKASTLSTPYDLKNGVQLTQENLKKPGNGYDINFCFDNDQKMHPIMSVQHLINGRKMSVFSDQPGAQLYTCNYFKGAVGKNGCSYAKQSAYAIETQTWPDSCNHENFPSSVLKAGDTYNHKTVFDFCI